MHVLGIGTDITECLRIARMIERHGELFLSRVYTPTEIDYCSNRKQATEHFTGRWAAKEAVLKALGTGWVRGISWRDIEIVNQPGGKPIVNLSGGAQAAAKRRGISHVFISISHCRTHATAFAVAVGEDDLP
ncbi:MAG: holo-[acyl-carrier-protein] synthase [Planctomycetota bacterium]|nr:MAG: holo-[acyl-carrier-protein] synthase [Planctomycetota bacterium]